MLAITGFLIIAIMMYLILKNKTLPVFTFVILPIIGAVICGFSLAEITDFIGKGVGSTWQTAILFIFSITFFGIMNDVGLFDNFVDFLVKKAGSNIPLILVATALIAMVGHIDGAAATTYLITIPAMLPIYKKLHLKPTVLLLICGAATGIMNLVPWGGPTVRAAATAGIDATVLWIKMIPMQIFGVIILIALAVYLGISESKRVKKLGLEINEDINFELAATLTEDAMELKRPKLVWINLTLTLLVIVALVNKWLPTYAVFMIATIIALMINYPNIKTQQERIQAHAPSSIMLTVTLLGAGIFLGILTHSGMVLEMSNILISAIPSSLQKYMHYIIAALGAPLGMVLGPDPYYYGIMPIIGEIVAPFGVTLETVGRAMLIGENVGLSVSPVVPTTFLAIGLAGVELKDHIKFSFMPLWIISLAMMIFAIILKII